MEEIRYIFGKTKVKVIKKLKRNEWLVQSDKEIFSICTANLWKHLRVTEEMITQKLEYITTFLKENNWLTQTKKVPTDTLQSCWLNIIDNVEDRTISLEEKWYNLIILETMLPPEYKKYQQENLEL